VVKTLLRDLVIAKTVTNNRQLIHSDLLDEIEDTAMKWSLSSLLKRMDVLHQTTLAIRANANTKLALEAMMLSWAEG
jgi:DNA polymerase III gamma/tau subunit